MKAALTILISLFMLASVGCSTSENTVDNVGLDTENLTPDGAVVNMPDYYTNLVDFLHRLPAVQVTGPTENPTITVRGISSFTSNIHPLYVIDGQSVGTDYVSVNRMINVRDIDHVRVLKGSDASIYGVRGGNGVIEIVTKR